MAERIVRGRSDRRLHRVPRSEPAGRADEGAESAIPSPVRFGQDDGGFSFQAGFHAFVIALQVLPRDIQIKVAKILVNAMAFKKLIELVR